MSYNNGPQPLQLTTNNDPNLWRTNSYYQRRQAQRNATRTRKNKPGIANKIRRWFTGKTPIPNSSQRRTRRRLRGGSARIMYE